MQHLFETCRWSLGWSFSQLRIPDAALHNDGVEAEGMSLHHMTDVQWSSSAWQGHEACGVRMWQVAVGAASVLVGQLTAIPVLRPQGAQQLAADLEYFCNVLSALGVAAPSSLATWQVLPAAPHTRTCTHAAWGLAGISVPYNTELTLMLFNALHRASAAASGSSHWGLLRNE